MRTARHNATLGPAPATAGLRWIDASKGRLPVRGLAWFGENRGSFSRLPLRAKGKVRHAVWNLAQAPAGAHLAFRSDTADVSVRVVNKGIELFPNMPVTGTCGLELFCGEPATVRSWVVAAADLKERSFERHLLKGLPRRIREYKLYLPLYQEVESLYVGLMTGARILPPSPTSLPKPIVFYGTSITQGAAALSAGTDFVSAIGRNLNVETINLGFSGNGYGDREAAALCAELDAAMFVLNYAENSDAKGMARTLPVFIDILRAARPHVPILLVTGILFSQDEYDEPTRDRIETRRDAMLQVYVSRRRAGDRNLHLVDGFGLISDHDSAYTDGVHPSPLGLDMMACRLTPLIRRLVLRDR